MTKQEKEEKNAEQLKENKLEEENQTLQQQLKVMVDLNNLKDESYYRQQMLVMIERQALATERMALALENSIEEEAEVPEEPKKK